MTLKNATFHRLLLHASTILTTVMILVFSLKDTGATKNQILGNEMVKIKTEQNVDNIPISFVTFRNKMENSSSSAIFGGQRGHLHTGICTVSLSPIWVLEELSNSAPFYIPNEKIEISDISESSIDKLLYEVEKFSKKDDGNIVVYIHGYNIDFDKGCRHSTVLQRSLGLHNRLLFFSWPADGNMLKYTWDEADLDWSVPYMADFFEDLVSSSGYGRTDIVAHSLGARGAVQALTRLAYQKNTIDLWLMNSF